MIHENPASSPSAVDHNEDILVPYGTHKSLDLKALIQSVALRSLTDAKGSKIRHSPQHRELAKTIRNQDNLRKNEHVEVAIVLKGNMKIWWEGSLDTLSHGSIIVIAPGIRFIPHFAERGQEHKSHTVLWVALYHDCAIVQISQIIDNNHHLSQYQCFVDSRITEIGKGLVMALSDRFREYELAIRGELMCLMTTLLRAPCEVLVRPDTVDKARRPVSQDGYQERVESYILSHYHIDFSLQQLALYMGNSSSHVCRRYREVSGLTPFQFARDVRVSAAKKLLLAGVPISRVANMVGFDDPLYFSKVFSGQVGKSPSHFRSQENKVSTNNSTFE